MVSDKNNITIIGAGPGGYVAAIRAAQLGAQVTLIEKDTLGGTCLNRGCIPTKALLHSAEAFSSAQHAKTFGVAVEKVSLNFPEVAKRKEMVVKRLVDGVASLMRKNKIKVVKGNGTIINGKTVGVVESGEEIKSDAIIIATGSKPLVPRIDGIDKANVLDSDGFLNMSQLPASVIILGGGVVGLEFAQILGKMGTKVTIIEMMPQILPREDAEIANMLEDVLKQDGIEIFTGAKVTRFESAGQHEKVVSCSTKDDESKIKAEEVVISVGRQANTDALGIEKLGLTLDKDRIVVNEKLETNIPGVYAIGDVTAGGYMLAHVAMHEGICAVENALGKDHRMSYRAVPRCVYTLPGMAAVGLTEAEARNERQEIQVGRFPFVGNGRAVTLEQTQGIVKIIADTEYGEILGVHILGSNATELIAEAVLAVQLEATYQDLSRAIHAHPTLSEAMGEAALGVEGRTIHF
ncbi:dihydrolipoyl dehydrogenase [Chloroflexota bacterium]